MKFTCKTKQKQKKTGLFTSGSLKVNLQTLYIKPNLLNAILNTQVYKNVILFLNANYSRFKQKLGVHQKVYEKRAYKKHHKF